MEIEICNKCKGEGEVTERVYRDDYETKMCNECFGTGRVYVRKYTIQVPYRPELIQKFNQIDSEIITKIRDAAKLFNNE